MQAKLADLQMRSLQEQHSEETSCLNATIEGLQAQLAGMSEAGPEAVSALEEQVAQLQAQVQEQASLEETIQALRLELAAASEPAEQARIKAKLAELQLRP